MRTLLIAACLLMLAPAAVAHGEHEIELEMHDGGGEYWFQLLNDETRNPTLALEPNEDYNVVVINMGDTAHDLNIDLDGDGDAEIRSTDETGGLLQPGQSAEFTMFVPPDASGTASYWCDPHKGLGMAGSVTFASDEESPGIGIVALLVGLVAVAAVARR